MTDRYNALAFGPDAATNASVARQRRVGSHLVYGEKPPGLDEGPDTLDGAGADLVRRARHFFLATVTATGWPYVQHRGGPAGFVHLLDPHTLAFADLGGNEQYVTTGNLDRDDRVALFFIDHPERRRVKVFGHAEVHEADDAPDLVERLRDLGERRLRSRVERAIVVHVEAVDVNCSKHIVPLFPAEHFDAREALYQRDLAALREENAALRRRLEQDGAGQ